MRKTFESSMRKKMEYRKILNIGMIIVFLTIPISHDEEYDLQFFLFKAADKKSELSTKEKMELFNRLDEVIQRAQRIRMHLLQALQTGEMDIRYQEGEFWVSKLERDQESIEMGTEQIKLLREKPTHLVASIKLYKSLKDLSAHFNAYNNMPFFSAWVGDLAPEIELWADPIFYQLHLLQTALLKDIEIKPSSPKGKKPPPKSKKP